ncbi:MAG TPA: hypothetical protein VFG73_02425 [Rhodanobacteraceae bacterium]|nr:hypothetical protein [Rhodanobacteraceae bacterium]
MSAILAGVAGFIGAIAGAALVLLARSLSEARALHRQAERDRAIREAALDDSLAAQVIRRFELAAASMTAVDFSAGRFATRPSRAARLIAWLRARPLLWKTTLGLLGVIGSVYLMFLAEAAL